MDTAFFVLAKVVWALIKTETWILLGITATCGCLLLTAYRAARIAGLTTLALIVGIGFFPVGEWMYQPLENRYPPNPPLSSVDGILILGGAEFAPRHGQPRFNEGAERYTETMALAVRFPDARVVYTGGSGALRNVARTPGFPSRTAELYFRGQGLDSDRLTFERASRNTAENARLSFELVRPQPDENWVLVTSAFHMPRALRSFERAGWTGLAPWPVDFRAANTVGFGWNLGNHLVQLNTAMKEYAGLLAYDITGR